MCMYFVCICSWMHVCVGMHYVCVVACVHVCMHVCMCVSCCVYVCTHACMCVYTCYTLLKLLSNVQMQKKTNSNTMPRE